MFRISEQGNWPVLLNNSIREGLFPELTLKASTGSKGEKNVKNPFSSQ